MVVGLTDDSFGSLTVEQMQKFSDHFKVPEQFAKLGDKIVAIPMISKEQQKQESVEQKDFEMNADTSGLTVAGHIGTWHTIDPVSYTHLDVYKRQTRKTRSCLQWRLPETISLTMTPRRKVSALPRPAQGSLKSW